MSEDRAMMTETKKETLRTLPNRETVISLMIKPFETQNTPHNRVCGLFTMIDQVFSEQHNPHTVMVGRCLKMIDTLLKQSPRLKVSVIPPKPMTINYFVEGMLKRAENVANHEGPSVLIHASEQFIEAFDNLFGLVQAKLTQFYHAQDNFTEDTMQQMVAHYSGLAQAFHAFRSSLFSFCRLFFQEQLYKLMHVPEQEVQEKLETIYSDILDENVRRLAVI